MITKEKVQPAMKSSGDGVQSQNDTVLQGLQELNTRLLASTAHDAWTEKNLARLRQEGSGL